MRTRVVVASAGARTALGQTLVETAFLLRTGVTAIAAAPLVDAEGEQVTMCFDPTQDPYLVGEERAAALARPALAEALAPLSAMAGSATAQLLLCLDERTARKTAPVDPLSGPSMFRAPAPAAVLAGQIHSAARELWPGIGLTVSARGAGGAAFALHKALDALAARQLDVLVFGAVHTDYDPAAIAELGAAGRLFNPSNLDSIIPGEAAAFAVLTREDVARRLQLHAEPLVRIAAVGTGLDRATAENDESAFAAHGITAAIRAAAEEVGELGMRIGWALTDHSFEVQRISEWQAMIVRTHALWGEPYVVESPAQRLGHLGAAALPLHLGLAGEGWRRGYAPAPMAMAFAGSDGGERGALLLLGPG